MKSSWMRIESAWRWSIWCLGDARRSHQTHFGQRETEPSMYSRWVIRQSRCSSIDPTISKQWWDSLWVASRTTPSPQRARATLPVCLPFHCQDSLAIFHHFEDCYLENLTIYGSCIFNTDLIAASRYKYHDHNYLFRAHLTAVRARCTSKLFVSKPQIRSAKYLLNRWYQTYKSILLYVMELKDDRSTKGNSWRHLDRSSQDI